jgi:putative MATE family efflux protein
MNSLQNHAPKKLKHRIDAFLERHYGSSLFSYRDILGMFIPLVLDQFFLGAMSLLTTSMISASSQASVSAVSLVSPVTALLTCLVNAIASGGTVIVAQYKGHGDEEKVRKAAGQVVSATFILATAVSLTLVALAGPIIQMMFGAADPEICEKARQYMIGASLSQIPFSLYSGVFAVFRGLGSTKACLRLTVVINGIHLIGSMIFINLMHLDILGTALSLNVARIIGGGMAMYLLMHQRSGQPIKPRDLIGFDGKLLKSIVKMAIPFAVEQLFFNGGSIIVQTYMVQLGTIALAANAVTNSFISVMFSVGHATATLAVTIVGQCVGAGETELARKYGKRMTQLGTIVCLLSIAVIYPLSPLLLKLYQPLPETLTVIYRLLFISVLPMPFFWSASNVLPNVLRSAGDVNFPSIVSLVTMWIVRVGAGYVAAIPLGLGIEGVWICMGVEWAVRSLIFGLRFHGKAWLSKRAID